MNTGLCSETTPTLCQPKCLMVATVMLGRTVSRWIMRKWLGEEREEEGRLGN